MFKNVLFDLLTLQQVQKFVGCKLGRALLLGVEPSLQSWKYIQLLTELYCEAACGAKP